MRSSKDVTLIAKTLEERTAPIIFISNKTGQGLDLFVGLLNNLPPHNNWDALIHDNAEFHINDADISPNDPVVIRGTVHKGTINQKQLMQLGPDNQGNFMYNNQLFVGK